MKLAAGVQSHTTAAAISSGSPKRPIGSRATIALTIIVRNVTGHADRVVPSRAYPLGTLAERLLVTVSKNHRCACVGESLRRGQTYPAAGTCDESDLLCQDPCHSHTIIFPAR